MLRHLWMLLLIAAVPASAADWITAPSYYSHDPVTGRYTNQYAQIGPYYYVHPQASIRSGYRHIRSTIQLNGSADNFHVVEEFGNPVRPYEEWRFPFRPYSAPYQAWGTPYAGLNGGGFGYGPFGGGFIPGAGGGLFGGGGNVNGTPPSLVPPGAGYVPQPYIDGYWPSYDRHDRSQYYQPYRN